MTNHAKTLYISSSEGKQVEMLTPEAILFDLDGVLIDSEQTYTEIWHKINLAFPTGVENFERRIKGTTLDNILSTYFKEENISAIKQMLYDEESRIVYRYTSGAEALLDTLSMKGLDTALVTSSNEVKMNKLFSQIPTLQKKIDDIIDASMVTRSKPDPQGYLLAAERLGKDISKCIVVEDSIQGAISGKTAGAYVIGISTTLGREAIEPYCDIVIDSLTQIGFQN